MRCKAFPEGVPSEITASRFDHRFSHPDDHGITFEKYTSRDDLSWLFAKDSFEEIESLFKSEIMQLEYDRNDGISLPPISNDPEQRFCSLLDTYNDLKLIRVAEKAFRLGELPLPLLITFIKEAYQALDPEIQQKYTLPAFDEIGE